MALCLLAAVTATSKTSTMVVASDTDSDGDGGPLGKAHIDSKETDDTDSRPGSGWRWDSDGPGPGPPDRRRDGSNRSDDDDSDEMLPETCSYYARPKRGCGKPRSCRDCLELDDCMINQFGGCVNITRDGYDQAMDFHKAFEFNLTGSAATRSNQTLRYHFPGRTSTYCPWNDEACIQCKRTVFAGDVSDSRFCVGANKCICIASCETTRWEQLAGGLRCGPPPRPKAFAADGPPPHKDDDRRDNDNDTGSRGGVNWRDVWTMGGIPALVVVVGLLVVRSHRIETKRRDQAAQQQQQQQQHQQQGISGSDEQARNDRSPEGGDNTVAAPRPGRLNLPGWQSLRRNQIKKETLLMDGVDVTPKHHFVDMLDTQQTVNPEMTILTAPVMGAQLAGASAPPMSPQRRDGDLEPSAPSFDSDFDRDDVNKG